MMHGIFAPVHDLLLLNAAMGLVEVFLGGGRADAPLSADDQLPHEFAVVVTESETAVAQGRLAVIAKVNLVSGTFPA